MVDQPEGLCLFVLLFHLNIASYQSGYWVQLFKWIRLSGSERFLPSSDTKQETEMKVRGFLWLELMQERWCLVSGGSLWVELDENHNSLRSDGVLQEVRLWEIGTPRGSERGWFGLIVKPHYSLNLSAYDDRLCPSNFFYVSKTFLMTKADMYFEVKRFYQGYWIRNIWHKNKNESPVYVGRKAGVAQSCFS